MDNFTKDRIERAEYILDSLSVISCILTNGYKGITPDREVKYDIPAFTLRENATNTISGAISLIGELIESWKEEAEDKETKSHALDILERLQAECPARYRSLSSIEVTPSSEKLTFWIPESTK